MRLRTALAKSKNLVSVRVLQAIGPQYAQDYIARFGFDPKQHPAYLTMGLGAGSATPLQMAGAYSVFANGGYRVQPYLIAAVTDARGNVLSEAKPAVAGENAERAIDPRNAFVMTSMLRDVVAYGHRDAGAVARPQGPRRQDRDHQRQRRRLVLRLQRRRSSAWRGSASTSRRRLGTNETGGVAALPIWISYMQKRAQGRARKAAGHARGRAVASASTPTPACATMAACQRVLLSPSTRRAHATMAWRHRSAAPGHEASRRAATSSF